jgi:hypothetical protein
MHPIARLVPLLLAAAGTAALAQAQDASKDLPKDLHGHWAPTAATGRAATEPFDLENINAHGDGTFDARLSWATPDPKCTIRYQRITGHVTASGLRFEPKTPCQEAWTAELSRGGSGWIGMASNTATPPAVVELSAK